MHVPSLVWTKGIGPVLIKLVRHWPGCFPSTTRAEQFESYLPEFVGPSKGRARRMVLQKEATAGGAPEPGNVGVDPQGLPAVLCSVSSAMSTGAIVQEPSTFTPLSMKMDGDHKF